MCNVGIIKLGTHRKKQLSEQIDTLLLEIHRLERIHKTLPAQPVEDKLSDLRDRLKSVLMDKAKAQLVCCRRVFYEYGNKPSRILANALKST